MLLSILVTADETGTFEWYDPGAAICSTENVTIPEDLVAPPDNTTYNSSAPFNVSGCCDSEGLVRVRFGTPANSNWTNLLDTYNVLWDGSQVHCECYLGLGFWSLGGEVSPLSCCGDDLGEFNVTQGIGNESCCDNANDCVDRYDRCQGEYPTEVTCDPWDFWDDDCDGLIDCSDSDCFSDPICSSCGTEICDNLVDDDCDRWIDCADEDCLTDPNCVACVLEDCTNTVDDDCDGAIDCADQDCLFDAACPLCIEEICNNGIDDDCDGFVDNADRDCLGCLPGQVLCVDGSCDYDCGDEGGNQGCVVEDGICDEGEGCDCADCIGQRDSCAIHLICDTFFELCVCPPGLISCPDGYCKPNCEACGNGVIEPGEECDGGTFGSGFTNCNDIDAFGAGALVCNPAGGDDSCLLDLSACVGVAGVCGDGNINTGEDCDTSNFDGKDCSSFDFSEGFLSCFAPGTGNECHFDTSGCFDEEGDCDNDGTCEIMDGEDCTCSDCIGKRGPCGFGQKCDTTAQCVCEDGTTLCDDKTCRAVCGSFNCNNNGTCDYGEGCSCADCDGKTDSCGISSLCIDGVCGYCQVDRAYWNETCIGGGVPDGVEMIVEGTPGCVGKPVTFALYEEDVLTADDPVALAPNNAVFDSNGIARLRWTPEFYNESVLPNECMGPICDADSDPGDAVTPPVSFLEYYFTADVGLESFQSEILNVHFCVWDCDKDCDSFVDNGLSGACSAEIDQGYGYHDGSFEVDANPFSGWCEDCMPDGLSPGQETCASFYDCRPNWFDEEPPGPWLGDDTWAEAKERLAWGECGEGKGATGANRQMATFLSRNRLICNPGEDLADCCDDQATCYCKMPDAQIMAEYNCGADEFKPSEIKKCVAEQKFGFFSNLNVLIVLLILTGFYFWRNKFYKH